MLQCTDSSHWGPSLDAAVDAVNRGAVIVLPTDTVYGVGADAFQAKAVAAVLAAKGRGRQMPPPVLIPQLRTVDGLGMDIPGTARALMEKFWPGALTVIVHSQPSLAWDLGETHGTVALRMPDHPAALALLNRTGPLAVTSANLTGQPAATSASAAEEQLGASVAVYLDGGESPGGTASTIVDATHPDGLRVVREGGVSVAELVDTVGAEAFVELPGETIG
ncbi:L-threonylcarbamoyladenylate synthase [Demequina sediminicola]|uniref:L-threonylcarbamoyladenylate synthase n=1 Tax=Demequina sediminicola TaxID=1095026 RepID=UPI00128D3514|nr:L-threonylcarbamoyladenylate synthase [Demequina sediminicola]